jgi:hypothetical protein
MGLKQDATPLNGWHLVYGEKTQGFMTICFESCATSRVRAQTSGAYR